MATHKRKEKDISNLETGLHVLSKMNDTFLNTLLELSEDENLKATRPHSVQHNRPGSVLFSRPPSSILISRPPSAAIYGRPPSSTKRPRRPPSTSTLRPRPPNVDPPVRRPPSVSTIARPSSSLKRPNALKCKVCADGFRFPGNTPCFDHYCAPCLEDHILTFKRGTGCDCPLCQSGILLPLTKLRPDSKRFSNKSELNVCNNCQEARLAQYRCGSCEEFFCEKCNREFLKRMRIDGNFSNTHLTDLSGDNAVPLIMPSGLDDDSLDSISLPSLLPTGFGLRCSEHEDEELRFHCKPCDKCICRDCKILGHEGHETLALEEVYEERKHHLSQALKLSNANIRTLHCECAEINSKRLEIDQESRDAVSQIENHANEAKRMINEWAKSMIKTIRVQNTQSRGKLEECRDVVKEKVKTLQTLVEKGTSLLESENSIDLVEKAPQMTQSIKDADIAPTADRLWRKKFVFQPTNLKSSNSKQMFGKLQTVVEGLLHEVPSVELEVQATFNSDQQYKSTTALAPMSDGTVWVCNGFKNRIQQFDCDGNLLQSETLDFDVDDMVDGRSDVLFLTELNGKVIRKLNKNNKLSIFARADLYLRGITISRDGKHVIACGNDVPVACLRDAAVSKIYLFNMVGKLTKEFTVDTGVKVVSLFRISNTINDEYVVSTGISALYYIFGEHGELKYRYRAASSADGVACDAHGLIYMSACKDDTLYILDCKGVPIPSTYAMHKPTAVAIDRNDVVWVGDWSKVHVLKYKN
ncbi:uncharacterized protein LOC123525189 [Mercenaria mercenaria]|uniref:uncharacterized protein LOC123525189 n=1 Tax=Mercenaria mercenaria TaxID=6596 RepID=UPI00234E50E8|nr:uncharacterized protein LOC123525189 [Mercenaria mercenaria]